MHRSSQTLDTADGSPPWGVDEACAKRAFVLVRILWQPLTKTRFLESYGEISFYQPSIRSSTTDHDSLFELPSPFPGEAGCAPTLSMDISPPRKCPGYPAYEPAAPGCPASRSFQYNQAAQVPTSKVTCKSLRSPWINCTIVAVLVSAAPGTSSPSSITAARNCRYPTEGDDAFRTGAQLRGRSSSEETVPGVLVTEAQMGLDARGRVRGGQKTWRSVAVSDSFIETDTRPHSAPIAETEARQRYGSWCLWHLETRKVRVRLAWINGS